jgi:hypothetical protein
MWLRNEIKPGSWTPITGKSMAFSFTKSSPRASLIIPACHSVISLMKKGVCLPQSGYEWQEDAKDTIFRVSTDETFKRGMLECELVNLLIKQGLQDVNLTYDGSSKRWFFSARWDAVTRQRLAVLAFAFKTGVLARTWMKIPDDSLWLMEHDDGLLSGTFVTLNSLLPG